MQRFSQRSQRKRPPPCSSAKTSVPSSVKFLILAILILAASLTVLAQVGDYENRPVSTVDVVLEGSPPDAAAQAEFKSLLKIGDGGEYSAVKARQSLQDLFASGRVASARV